MFEVPTFNYRTILRAFLAPVLMLTLAFGSFVSCSMFEGRETAGQYVDDSTITAKVKESFVADSKVQAMQINVETMQGVVQLSGFVDSLETKARAVTLAHHVGGVKAVQDNITVRAIPNNG